MQSKKARAIEAAVLSTLTRGELEKVKLDAKAQVGRIEQRMRELQSERDEQTKLIALANRAINLKGV